MLRTVHSLTTLTAWGKLGKSQSPPSGKSPKHPWANPEFIRLARLHKDFY